MTIPIHIQEQVECDGFAVIDEVFTDEQIDLLISYIELADTVKPTFRKTTDLFAIRQVFNEIPAAIDKVFTDNLKDIVTNILGDKYFVVKSIYFDKPGNSNWFVSYHQDLTISVDKKLDLPGFGPWTTKQNQFAVQPPTAMLQDNFTIRIHLDNTDENNGALKVIPGSHLKGVYRPENINWTIEVERFCCVEKGGVMIMKPLLLHSSNKTRNNAKRRVLHIEFSRSRLPDGLNWAERLRAQASH